MFVTDINRAAEENENFRKVLHTGKYSQIVVMSLGLNEEIGQEVHETTDQLFFIVEGKAEVTMGSEKRIVEEDDSFFVPAGVMHNVKNSGDETLKLYTVYAPPTHKDGTIHVTKADAEKEEA